MASTRDAYLETQVLTATPQQLHLLLIEGAIRRLASARQRRLNGDIPGANEWLGRAEEIASELLANVAGGKDALARQVAGVYLFIFRQVTAAQAAQDVQAIDDAIRVLEAERETWRTVCGAAGSTTAAEPEPATAHRVDAPRRPAPLWDASSARRAGDSLSLQG